MFGRLAKVAMFAAVLTGWVQASHATETCSSATPLAIGRQTFSIGSLNDGAAPPCSTTAVGDRWFTFVPPRLGTYRFETCNVFPFLVDTTLAIYSGTCGNLQLITCSNTGCGAGNVSATASALLVGGTTYRVRVLGSSVSSLGNGIGEINVSPGDVCGNAVVVTTGTTNFNAGMETSTVTASCGTSVRDVFFAFTPTRTATYELSTCNITPNIVDTVLSMYTGTCGALTQIACSDDAAACGLSDRSSRVTMQLSSGTRYVIRVAAKDAASVGNGQGRLTITDLTPANDTCSSPQIVTMGSNSYNALYANTDGPDANCSVGSVRDVFFQFTPAFAGRYRITNCATSASGMVDTVMTLFGGGNCSAPVLACNNDSCGSGGRASAVEYTVTLSDIGQPRLIRLAAVNNASVGTGLGVLTIESVGQSCADAIEPALSFVPAEYDTRVNAASADGCGAGPQLYFRHVPQTPGRYIVRFNRCPTTALSVGTVEECVVSQCWQLQSACSSNQTLGPVLRFDVEPASTPGGGLSPFAFVVDSASTATAGSFNLHIFRAPSNTLEAPTQPLTAGDTLRLTLAVGHVVPDAPLQFVYIESLGGLNTDTSNNLLVDDGTQGDAVAGDRVYTWEATLAPGNESRWYEVWVIASFATPGRPTSFLSRASVQFVSCDPVDFNNDGVFPDDRDIADFVDVMAGANCPSCNDIDFNNDGLFPDDSDLRAFFSVFAGGPCL